jgi:hypothetical protein
MTQTAVPSSLTIQRRFDIDVDITTVWFRSLVDELAKYATSPEIVDCQVRLRPDLDHFIRFNDRQSFVDFVVSHWTDVAESSISQDRKSAIPRAVCNHRRQHLFLNVKAPDMSFAEETYKDLCDRMSLSPSRELPFRYRRSLIEFEVGNWRPDLFISGVKKIASLIGTDPDIPQAYAKSFEGDVEKLTSFFELEDFCNTIGMRASRFEEIAIRMQARSSAIGIGVPSDHKKLRIRTSFKSDELDNIIAAWPEDLKLKQVKAADTGIGAASAIPPPSENLWLKHSIPIIVAFVTAASAAGFVSFKKAFSPDYKVVMDSPRVEKGIATWVGNSVSFNWSLQPDQPSFRGIEKDVKATIHVYSPNGDQSEISEKPPYQFTARPGTYQIYIDAPDAQPISFQLVLKAPSSK